jgi:hypothetical protein
LERKLSPFLQFFTDIKWFTEIVEVALMVPYVDHGSMHVSLERQSESANRMLHYSVITLLVSKHFEKTFTCNRHACIRNSQLWQDSVVQGASRYSIRIPMAHAANLTLIFPFPAVNRATRSL